jgi:uncharacterized protein (DUF2236 family)
MLIDYGERAHALVFGPMGKDERLEHFRGTITIGRALHIDGLPDDYATYQTLRQSHLDNNTEHSRFTDMLYARYRDHLGAWRMRALLDLQASLVPPRVAELLNLRRKPHVDRLLRFYQCLLRGRRLRWLYPLLLPRPYGSALAALERTV